MNKKGFTLIEIIVVLIIITIIGVGSFVGVRVYNNNKTKNFYSQFDDALSVYLAEHPEVYNNLSDNVEGAVVTLTVLKNAGLIKDNIVDLDGNKLDYDNNYYVLSNAVEVKDSSEADCTGQVAISVLSSWGDLKNKVDTSDILYICPKENSNNDDINSTLEEYYKYILDLQVRIGKLEARTTGEVHYYTGESPKNWVQLNVKSENTKFAYWPKDANQNKWRIVYSTENEALLIYNKAVPSNNKLNYDYGDPKKYNSSDKTTINGNAVGKIELDELPNCKVRYRTTLKTQSSLYKYNGNYYYKRSGTYSYYDLTNPFEKDSAVEEFCKLKVGGSSGIYYHYKDDGWTYFDLWNAYDPVSGVYKDGTKKRYLFEDIINNKHIEEITYYDAYASNSYDISYSGGLTEKLGTINKEIIDKTRDQQGKSWITSIIKGAYGLGGSYVGKFKDPNSFSNWYPVYYNDGHYPLLNPYEESWEDKTDSKDLYGINYVPVITIKGDFNSFVSGNGTESSPYVFKLNGSCNSNSTTAC